MNCGLHTMVYDLVCNDFWLFFFFHLHKIKLQWFSLQFLNEEIFYMHSIKILNFRSTDSLLKYALDQTNMTSNLVSSFAISWQQ